MLSKYDNYSLIYSPRTKLSLIKEEEDKLFNDLQLCFEPDTMLTIKTHFKEHLGILDKITFITIFKKHLTLWHPNLPNRNEILIKLLSRLFDEIDINSNDILEWSEFINYLTSNAKKDISYNYGDSKRYIVSKTPLNHKEKNDLYQKINSINQYDIVSYSFYIQKYKLIGIVHENKSKIFFFNSESHLKENTEIDLMQTQNLIDEFELNELNQKTKLMLKIESETKKIIKKNEKDKLKKEIQDIISYNNRNILSLDNRNFIRKSTRQIALLFNQKKNLKNKNEKERQKSYKKYLEGNIELDNNNFDINNDLNILNGKKNDTKLCTIKAYFTEKYNLLFVSSSNNKISVWKFDPNTHEFKNVNTTSNNKNDYSFNSDDIKIPFFASEIPQYTLCFDDLKKFLYSGQEDGKILVWSMDSSKPIDTLDINEYNNKKNSNSLLQNSKDLDILGFLKQIKDFQDKCESNISRSHFANFNIENTINELALKELKMKKLKEKMIIENKRKIVSCLLIIDSLRLLCSTYYTGQIVLWDTESKKPKKIFNDQTTGIYNIAFDEKKNIIYTSGFDHEIYAYAPYNDNFCIYKLKGHNSSIKSMALNHEQNELITIDIMGNMKVWDLNTSTNFQTININDSVLIEQNHLKKLLEQQNNYNMPIKQSTNLHLISLPNVNKILIYGEKFLIFEKGKTKNPNLCDDNVILGSLYNSLKNEIITFSNKRIKFWNIFDGTCKKILEDPLNGNEITAFTCDKRLKRFYLGEINGRIKNFNMSDGTFLKDFRPHKTEITNIIYSSKYEYLISCSTDLTILIQTDDQILKTELIKEINLSYLLSNISLKDNKNLIRGLKFNEKRNVILIMLFDGYISYFDLNHLKFIDNIEEKDKEDYQRRKYPITNIEEITDANLLFISRENGDKYFIVNIFNKYYHLLKNKKLGKLQDIYYAKNKNGENISKIELSKNMVMYSKYDNSNHKFFTGDYYGFISCFDLSKMVILLNKKTAEEVEDNFIYHNIYIEMIYLVQGNKESIKYIDISKEIMPKILIITNSNRTVLLYDYNTGEYIDSLKQKVDKNYPVPIGIQYFKNNPFFEDININKKNKIFYKEEDIKNDIKKKLSEEELNTNNENNIVDSKQKFPQEVSVIYRESNNKIFNPNLNKNNILYNNPYLISNDICEYNARVKLKLFTSNTDIKPFKSTNWNYNIDIDYILQKSNKNFNDLLTNVVNKEKEITQTEKLYLANSIFSNDYKPLFLHNFNKEEKKFFNEVLENKIKSIQYAIRRKNILNCQQESYKNIEKTINKKFSNNKNNIYNTISTSQKKIKIKNLKKNTSRKSTDKRIKLDNILLNFSDENFYNNKDKDNENKTLKKFMKNKKTFSSSDILSDEIKNRENTTKRRTIIEEKHNFKFNDKRFNINLNIFEKRYNELHKPLDYLIHYKKAKLKKLPLINKSNSNFNSQI